MGRIHVATLDDGTEVYVYIPGWFYSRMEKDATIEEVEDYLIQGRKE